MDYKVRKHASIKLKQKNHHINAPEKCAATYAGVSEGTI